MLSLVETSTITSCSSFPVTRTVTDVDGSDSRTGACGPNIPISTAKYQI